MPPSTSATPAPGSTASFNKLQKIIGLKFKNIALLEEALTHKSYAMERGGNIAFNERLEFLGDSVLSTAVAHYLFDRYPDVDEGRLSQLKSMLVSRPSLTVWGRDLGLGEFLQLSSGEAATGGRDRDSILGNAMEAILGAMYLEGGFDAAKKFIDKLLAKKKRLVTTDHKSKLQEWAQKQFKIPPSYIVRKSSGPDHAKVFEIEVSVGQQVFGRGSGKSKKEAEQAAARDSLRKIKDL